MLRTICSYCCCFNLSSPSVPNSLEKFPDPPPVLGCWGGRKLQCWQNSPQRTTAGAHRLHGLSSVIPSLLSFSYYVCLSSLVVSWSHQLCQKVFHWDRKGTGARWPLTCWQLAPSFLPWQPCTLEGLASNLVISTSPVPCDLHQAKVLFKQQSWLGWSVALCHLRPWNQVFPAQFWPVLKDVGFLSFAKMAFCLQHAVANIFVLPLTFNLNLRFYLYIVFGGYGLKAFKTECFSATLPSCALWKAQNLPQSQTWSSVDLAFLFPGTISIADRTGLIMLLPPQMLPSNLHGGTPSSKPGNSFNKFHSPSRESVVSFIPLRLHGVNVKMRRAVHYQNYTYIWDWWLKKTY